jgi:hypothetical protein
MRLHQIKSFCTVKETSTSVKRWPAEWEKILISYSSNRGVISRIHKELKKRKSTRVVFRIQDSKIKHHLKLLSPTSFCLFLSFFLLFVELGYEPALFCGLFLR